MRGHLLSVIKHHGIMKMVDCYEDTKHVHIITKKYTGGELFEKIIDNATASGCLSERKTSGIIKSLLQAVDYLHKNDIVHQDIKPENILFELEKEDTIKLIDFGLSRRHKKGDQPMSNPIGTAYYMSPELFKGKYDKSCDIWSIGVVAYILLCGYPPFNGDTDLDIFESIERGQCQFPVQAGPQKVTGRRTSSSVCCGEIDERGSRQMRLPVFLDCNLAKGTMKKILGNVGFYVPRCRNIVTFK